MKNNYLVVVSTDTILSKLKQESNITFLFPIKGFSVGYPQTFKIEDIHEEHAFILVNRMLDQEGILKFKEMICNLPKNIEGIVFDDIGVLQILLDSNLNLTKILFLNHFNCNYVSINAYLSYVDSVVVSTDITKDEVKEILKKAYKPLVLYTFGHMNIMYSRRKLITNYNEHFQHEEDQINEIVNDMGSSFKIVENDYGTVIYTGEPFNGLDFRGSENVLYYLINTVFLSFEEVERILHSDDDLKSEYPYKYLSNEETIVRIKER